MKRVILAEKRNAAEDIAKAIGLRNIERKGKSGFIHGYDRDGSEIVITWSNGHILALPEPTDIDLKYKKWSVEDLPIPLDNDKSLNVVKEKASLYRDIREELKDADDIVNAGDAGREGELIQRWILRLALDTPKEPFRLWVSSLTEKSIRGAYEKLLGTTEEEKARLNALYDSGRARAIMDKYTGYNYSRLISLTQTDGVTVNYGRCKSPLVHAICERDKENENFISVPFKYITLKLSKEEREFKAVLVDKNRKRIEFSEDGEIEAKSIIDEIPEELEASTIEKKVKKVMPPAPYDTLQIQKEMANLYGYEADYTLGLLESLYDTHHILSYPRTEARVYSDDLRDDLRNVLSSLNFEPFRDYVDKALESDIPDKYFNDKKIADHHAICPVSEGNLRTKYQKLSEPEKRVYDHVIWNFIALHLPAYEFEAVETILVGNEKLFLSKGRHVIDPGFKIINAQANEEEEEDPELPKLQEGERVRVVEAEIIDSKTKPKARYTTASLLDFMKLNNIGTGATRDKIIKELTEKKGMNKESAVIKDGKYFVSTEFGRKMDGVIPDEIKSIDYVKNLEKRINAIAEGKDSLESFISDMQADFNSMLKELKGNRSSKLVQHYPNEKLNTDMICPCCGKAIANVGWGYSCTGWKKDGSGCNFAIGNKQYGKTISEKIVKQLINNKKSSVALKGLKKKNGETFKSAAYLTLDIMPDGRAKVGFTFE